ncbi:hypothetical protein JMN32_01970 [Fulvivirga sp. 29W222]|uniref:Response regulatory domain-containing protein n=1 Tax=Fulvivirga marina TaxID=2494733 RepID=A0A937KCK1_9BACT|nr:hypothetical protein [Fulvivirga marina]MBL6445055.1 hypothetical protein [Fulvivirga marina]
MNRDENRDIAFFSNSNEVFESIPNQAFKLWDIFLVSPDSSSPYLERIKEPALIIVDTYSLGLDFLQLICDNQYEWSCPVLVLDHYTERLLIESIIDRGANGYLLVHSFEEELPEAIEHLLEGGKYVSTLLESYKGNTYLLK